MYLFSENIPDNLILSVSDCLIYISNLIDCQIKEYNYLTITECARIEHEILLWNHVLRYKQIQIGTGGMYFFRQLIFKADIEAALNFHAETIKDRLQQITIF